MTRGCCNATKVTLIEALRKRMKAERNPDVKRGLQIAIYEITRTEGERWKRA